MLYQYKNPSSSDLALMSKETAMMTAEKNSDLGHCALTNATSSSSPSSSSIRDAYMAACAARTSLSLTSMPSSSQCCYSSSPDASTRMNGSGSGSNTSNANTNARTPTSAGYGLPFPQILMNLLHSTTTTRTTTTTASTTTAVAAAAAATPVIAWSSHGTSFHIHNKRKFITDVLPTYFPSSTNKFTSFARRLARWGFIRVVQGPDTGAYYHPLFRRDMPELCLQMSPNGSSSPKAKQQQPAVDNGDRTAASASATGLIHEEQLQLQLGGDDLENAAQAVLSLRNMSEDEGGEDWSSDQDEDVDSCPGQEDETMAMEEVVHDYDGGDHDCGDHDYMVYNDDDADDELAKAEEEQDKSNWSEEDNNDVATRLKRMAVCCRRYNIRPNNFATVEEEGVIQPLLDEARMVIMKGEQPDKTNTSSTAAAAITTTVAAKDGAVANGEGTDLKPREAKRMAKKGIAGGDGAVVNNEGGKTLKKLTAKGPAKRVAKKGKATTKATARAKGGRTAARSPMFVRPATEFGKGWVIKGYERKTGSYVGHIDKYWYSPGNKKFRSMAEVRRFLSALKTCNGDEDKAYAMK